MRLHEVTRLNMPCTSEGPLRTLRLGKLGAAASPLGRAEAAGAPGGSKLTAVGGGGQLPGRP